MWESAKAMGFAVEALESELACVVTQSAFERVSDYTNPLQPHNKANCTGIKTQLPHGNEQKENSNKTQTR